MKRAAIFLDRDGTLNIEKNYLYRIEDFEWIPGAVEAIRQINLMGYLAIVVSNQSGIARGYYESKAVHELHQHMSHLLDRVGARIDGYYFCPHHPAFGVARNCTCRKPEPGMLLQAQKTFDIDMRRSWFIGDKLSDIEAGFKAGVSPILVRTGYGSDVHASIASSCFSEVDVVSAVRRIELLNYHE